MELITYTFMVFLLFISAIITNKERIKGKLHRIFYIVIILVFIYTIRSFPQSDMITYIKEFNLPLVVMLSSSYYLREAFFWLSSSFITNLFKSTTYAFWFWDILTLLAVLRIRKNFNLPDYYILLYYGTFITLLGLENIYRQFIATTFLLLSISYVLKQSKLKSLFFLLLAIFSHNVVIMFAPLYLLGYPKFKKKWKLIMLLVLLFELVTLPIFLHSKSEAETGLELKYVYLFVIFATFFPILLSSKIRSKKIDRIFLYVFLFVFGVYSISLLFLGGIVERIGMIALIVLQLFVLYFYEKYWNLAILRFYMLSLYVLPSYIFAATMYFLDNKVVFP